MKPSSTIALFAVPLLLATAALGPAKASLIHNLQSTGDVSGSGQIEFTTTSGSSIGDVAAFSFSGTADLGLGVLENFTLGLGDINQIVWSIDSSWNLSVGISTNDLAPGADHGDCLIIAIAQPSLTECTVDLGSGPMTVLGLNPGVTEAVYAHTDGISGILIVGSTSSTPVHGVSESGTAWLFGVGLLALALLMRRPRRMA